MAMTMRNRWRSIELAVIRPSPTLVGASVIALSGGLTVGLAAYAALGYAPHHRLQAAAYLVLAVITRAIAMFLRQGVDYHPGHRNKENVTAYALLLLAALTFGRDSLAEAGDRIGFTFNAWVPWIWIGILFIAQLSMLGFTMYRNIDPDRIVIKTVRGLVQVPEQRVREQIAEEVAGWLRHGLISSDNRELLTEGLGFKASDKYAEELREQYRQHREKAAADDVLAAHIELMAEDDGPVQA